MATQTPIPTEPVAVQEQAPTQTFGQRLGSYVPSWVKAITNSGLRSPPNLDRASSAAEAIFARSAYREGLVASIATPINENLQIVNNFTFGKPNAQKYSFMAQYAEEFQKGTDMLMVMGEIDHNGKLDGSIKYQVNPDLLLKINSSMKSKGERPMHVYEAEYKGSDWCGSLQLANPNIFDDSGVVLAQYAQSITNRLSMGIVGEFAVQQNFKVFTVNMAHILYEGSDASACALVTPSTSILQYVRQISPKVAAASQLSFDFASGKTSLCAGYTYLFRTAEVRGCVDQDGLVTGMVERQLAPGIRIGFGGTVGTTQTFGFNLRFGA